MIRVYNGAGVVQPSLKTLLFELAKWGPALISAEEIIQSKWECDTDLLIIPGGRDLEYLNSLKGIGNANIRRFVENGGAFLGICAGAYYGCRYVEFDKGMPLEVIGERELLFFPGVGKGPAYGPGTFEYESEKGAQAAHISAPFFEGTFKTYFNGGCYFPEAENFGKVSILSKYLDLPEKPPAVIECCIGRGKAILSGVHFEIGVSDPNTTLTRGFRKTLLEHEKRRLVFFEEVINKLLH